MTNDKAALIASVRSRLKKRPRDLFLQTIADETGVKHSWLKDFSAGKFANPHMRYIVRLDEYFTKASA